MGEPLRFFLDQHIPYLAAWGLRQRGVDVLTTQEAGRCDQPDEAQLQFAAAENRVLVTFDADYLRLAASGLPHAGIAYCHPAKYEASQLLQILLILHGVMDPSDMQNHVEYL